MTTMDDKTVSGCVTESANCSSPMDIASAILSEETCGTAIPGSAIVEVDSGMAHISCSNDSLDENTGNTEDENAMPPASVFSMRDRCWLCQCLRKDEENDEDDDDDDDDICLTRTKDGALQEFLPWLCKTCEKTMEEEERKAEPTPLTDDDLSDGVTGPTCNCESCTKARDVELEQEELAKELEQCWLELSQVVRCIYHMSTVSTAAGSATSSPCRQSTASNTNRAGAGGGQDTTKLLPTDVERMKDYVCRLCLQDADQLYQRLESQVREVVIEMKVRLLKELTVDLKLATRAHQFVALLLDEYLRLCASSQQATKFLSIFEEQHLRQFNLTWQLHNKHLFHSVIFSDPVVQNCLPKVISHLRASLSADDCVEFVAQYNRTLADYQRFETEMSVIGTVWKDCKRLIEQYNEAQAALRLKQKMFKEDWAFFKAQRRLLEQAMPKNKIMLSAGNSQCCFDVQFNEMMKNILQGKKTDDYQCPACKQPRCPCDECNISHMITCGIISPDVTDQIPSHHHPHPLPLHHPPHPPHPKPRDPRPCGEGSSPPPLPPPLAFPRYYANVKPPSMPSSSSSSRSESPIVIDRYRFFADNFDFNDITGVDNDGDYFDIDNNAEKADATLSLAAITSGATRHKSTTTDAGDNIDSFVDGELDESSPLKEVRPSTSSLVARMMMASVNLSGDKATCTCPHCLMNNGTLCMFESARRRLNEPKPAVDRLQLSQFGMSRRLLNPQLYELHDDLSPTRDDDDDDDMTGNSDGNAISPKNGDDGAKESASFENFGMPSIWSSVTAAENDPVAAAWPESHKTNASATEKPHDLNPVPSSPAVDRADLKFVSSNVNGSANGKTVIKMEIGSEAVAASPTAKSSVEVLSAKAATGSQTSACVVKGNVVMPPVTSADLSPSKAKRCLGTVATPVSKTDGKRADLGCSAAVAAKNVATATPCTAARRSQSVCQATTAAQIPPCKEPCRSQSTPTQCKAANVAAAAPKLPASMANSGAAMKLLVDAVGRTKLAASTTGQCGGAHDDTTHGTAAAPATTDNGANSGGCTGDKSGRGSAAGGAGQKDGGKFCECWHCEFFGHVPSTLPLSRNYAEIRDRLRLRLQKKKERKTPGAVGTAGLSITCSDPSKSPTGSPRPELPTPPAMLNDKEVEEIIRFINGVDEVMNASQGATAASSTATVVNSNSKQKTKTKRKVQMRDGSKPVVDGSKSLADVSKKDELVSGSPSKMSSMHTPPQCQAMKISKTDFAAELSSQLAALRDAATRYGVTLQADTASSSTGSNSSACSNSSALPTPPTKCRKQQLTGSRSGTPSAQKLPTTQMAASPTLKDGTAEIIARRAAAQRTESQPSSSPARQQQQKVEGSAGKGKRQKAERHDDTAPFDDIFLPSDEVNGRTESDDFDREIEEFKRFCYNSWLMQKRERQRVTLNLKDIFARKKAHQGCTS